MKKYFVFLLTTLSFGGLAGFAGPSATPSPSPSGPVPLGLDPSKVNLTVYQNLPGIQPPILDLDGRDLSGEALAMINTAQPASLLPGMPTGSVTPQPFPANPLSAPTPAPSATPKK
jgi:hypothetical protein